MKFPNSPKIKVKIGDIFLIPVEPTSWVIGQLIKKNRSELYVAVFEERYVSTDVNPRCVIGKKPLLLVLTLDGKLYHGMWPIIGNVKDNINDFPEPAFKIGINGSAYLVSRDETVCRPATDKDLTVLQLRTVTSPQGIENVILNHFGLGKTYEDLNYYYAKYAEKTSELLQADRLGIKS